VDVVAEMIGDAARRWCDDRQSARHRLEYDEAERLGERREEEGVGARIEPRQRSLSVQHAEEEHVLPAERAKRVLFWSGAGDHQSNRAGREQLSRAEKRFDDLIGALLGGEASDV